MDGRPAPERREELVSLYKRARDCTLCPLSEGRTQVVFGNGNADADLMFVGEAPGFHEDQQGIPFVGRAGNLLGELLEEINLSRDEVFVANVLKCLRYRAQVQLGDGSWERIGRLVRSRYAGEVMSVDAAGRLVPRRVTGWHATPVGNRRVFRLTYKSAKRVGTHRVGVELTGDHPVLTERGYVPVERLRPDDRIATGQGLSQVADDAVAGTLLGDGSISAKSAHLTFGHSLKQRDYALFKSSLVAELSPRVSELEVAAVAGGARKYGVIHVRTLAHRALGVLRRDFYRPDKVVPPWVADCLNHRMLAVWFMDDGYTRIRPGARRPLAEIATVGFDPDSVETLVDALHEAGFPAKSLRGRIYFDVAATEDLCMQIAPYAPQSMRYKLHPDVERQIPFEPSAWARETPMVLYDDFELEDVTDHHRSDKTFFCIDVEGTNNFVTAGGVVHNCRPPGNRDPQPDEIDTCKPYLFKQVELIEPRVICTLGNFATKLLTRSNRGITSVRGQPQVHELGARWVRIYPILHPAAALRTPRVKEQLQEDFARLPALLAEPPPQPPAALRAPAAVAAHEPEPSADQLDLFG